MKPVWVKIHWENPPFWGLVIESNKYPNGHNTFSCVVLHKDGITDPVYCQYGDFASEPSLDDI